MKRLLLAGFGAQKDSLMENFAFSWLLCNKWCNLEGVCILVRCWQSPFYMLCMMCPLPWVCSHQTECLHYSSNLGLASWCYKFKSRSCHKACSRSVPWGIVASCLFFIMLFMSKMWHGTIVMLVLYLVNLLPLTWVSLCLMFHNILIIWNKPLVR